MIILLKKNKLTLLIYIIQTLLFGGGVFGLDRFVIFTYLPPSNGFNLKKLHIKFSSTDITAPELSNSPQ